MKVLDLACQQGHGFEGWFGSEEDFQNQLARGLVQCPICDDAHIIKKLSAPRLNLSGAKENSSPLNPAETDDQPGNAIDNVANYSNNTGASGQLIPQNPSSPPEAAHPLSALMRNPEFQAAYMQMAKEVLAKTEDVGQDFAREARKIHYGESKERGIRGQASHDETMELLDEGIDVMPLPLPKALKGPLH
jgi:hypothetical protein